MLGGNETVGVRDNRIEHRNPNHQIKETVMENARSTRGVGRPKARLQTGPLVLEASRARAKLELELGEETAGELTDYARWVELSSSLATGDALFTTVDYALRELFRRDRLWHEHRKNGDRSRSSASSSARPPASPSPASLPPPTAAGRPVPSPTPATDKKAP